MSEKLLNQILEELKGVKSQLDENTQMTRAIYDRQEEADAKLEAFSMDVHKAYGKITALEENSTIIKDKLTNIEDKLAFTSFKTFQNEEEIFKLRKEHLE